MDKLELFRNLMFLANSDGKFREEEVEFLSARAERWGISREEVDEIIEGLKSGAVEFSVPPLQVERDDLLREMIRCMAVDGELAKSEKMLCAAAAVAMEYSDEQFNAVLEELLNEASN